MNFRPTIAEINLDHLRHNVSLLKKLNGHHSFFCPMVKANAYGHGDIEISKALIQMGIKTLGVVLVEEGVRLRESGIPDPILVFGYFDERSLKQCVEYQLTPVLGTLESLDFLPLDKKIKIHLEFDTGMSRMGFPVESIKKILEKLESKKNVEVEGICTHFAKSEDSLDPNGFTRHQIELFSNVEKGLQGHYKFSHCRNSGALLNIFEGVEDLHRSSHFMGSRPGISIYGYGKVDIKSYQRSEQKNSTGLSPSGLNLENKNSNEDFRLKPLMTLKTAIAQVHKIPSGQPVSYGGIWKTKRDSVIATLPLGYADGYKRNLSNFQIENQDYDTRFVPVLFRGKRIPLVGRICMDYSMIDITDAIRPGEDLSQLIGAEVVVWGHQGSELLGADELADFMETISYELITNVSARVPKIYI